MLPRLAIPSYKREHILLSHTLSYLSQEQYPPDLIFIFVASEEERVRYEEVLPRRSYHSLVVGVKGLMEQRNFISQWAEEGELLLQMDDDVKGVRFLDPQGSFRSLVLKGVKELEGGKRGLFGVLPNDDKRRFKDATTYHLTHILGSFFLCRNHRSLEITHTEKEDFERSILYFKLYGNVVRYQGAGVQTKFRGTPGGLQESGRSEREAQGLRMLLARYPEYTKRVEKPKGEDVVLNWRVKPLVSYSPSEDEEGHP